MSLCDNCYAATCCRAFSLFGQLDATFTKDQVRKMVQDWWNYPFEPLHISETNGSWMFTCPKLVNERCSIYKDRPDVCRNYVAGSDGICSRHSPIEAGDPTVDIDRTTLRLPAA